MITFLRALRAFALKTKKEIVSRQLLGHGHDLTPGLEDHLKTIVAMFLL